MAIDAIPVMERTVPLLLQRQAQRFGHAPVLTIPGALWHHDEVAGYAAARAGALRAAGIARGDRVAVMAGNRVETIETALACGWMGAVAVPINTGSMAAQVGHVLRDSGAKLLVCEAPFLERRPSPLPETLESVWVVGEGKPGVSAFAGTTEVGARTPVKVDAWPQADAAVEAADLLPGDLFAILYTSGTTGAPKGVMCPHAQYVAWGINTARILGVTADDVLCTTLPLFHINALNTYAQAAVAGCHAVVEPRFSVSGFWKTMHERQATVVYLLGAMVPMLLAQAPSPAERGHRIRIGLGPGVPAAAASAFRERTGVALLEGYGSTESNFVLATQAGAEPDGTMGAVQPGFHARVVDEHDVEVPAGEAGELVLRADEPYAFASGYWGLPQQTVDAWRNLWFHTGDRVVREADGRIRFVDRLKDVIRRRGENISSWEVEQILLSHPSVGAAAVFPVKSELAEDEVMAALLLKDGATFDAQDVWAWCEGKLPKFAVPRYLEAMDDLPRTANGKVQKFVLRERGVTAATVDRSFVIPAKAGIQDGGREDSEGRTGPLPSQG
jgi:crotonobetaine/carnitine-CoA ligase